jgi:hypothetical protein
MNTTRVVVLGHFHKSTSGIMTPPDRLRFAAWIVFIDQYDGYEPVYDEHPFYRQIEIIDLLFSNRQAEIAAEHVRKANPLMIEGPLTIDTPKDEHYKPSWATITVENMSVSIWNPEDPMPSPWQSISTDPEFGELSTRLEPEPPR